MEQTSSDTIKPPVVFPLSASRNWTSTISLSINLSGAFPELKSRFRVVFWGELLRVKEFRTEHGKGWTIWAQLPAASFRLSVCQQRAEGPQTTFSWLQHIPTRQCTLLCKPTNLSQNRTANACNTLCIVFAVWQPQCVSSEVFVCVLVFWCEAVDEVFSN